MVEDDCTASRCAYASCVRGRLLSGGLCGFSVKRKTDFAEEEVPEALEVKVKGKLLRKVSKEELI
jgi:hypothetical protein